MISTMLPSRKEMLAALYRRDPAYEGVFVIAVRSTGIFCRPNCPARPPAPENVEFFASPRDALFAGYRACLRCRPLEPAGAPPDWLRPLLAAADANPTRRFSDAEIRAQGVDPGRVRRWFHKHHGMTFQAYGRARRLAAALGQIKNGAPVLETALDQGYDSLSGFNAAFAQLFGVPPTIASHHRTPIATKRLLTPLGPMLACATPRGLCLLEFTDRRMLERQLKRIGRRLSGQPVPGPSPILDRTEVELARYFAGDLAAFGVPIDSPGSEFQQAVWTRLGKIPHGDTTTYGRIASELGRPTGARAVARAVGDNPIAILVPCHRVVGSDGRLTGYGGGLWRKQKLLSHEAGEKLAGPWTADDRVSASR
jgi:AraC family transcriptional regulator of adaptative response/methylated-DNA-[protein]-cysteine methyltransferase